MVIQEIVCATKKRLSEVVNSFVLALLEKDQKVFLCRYWYIESVDVISKRFGFSAGKVKSMLYRTRMKLRAVLTKERLE